MDSRDAIKSQYHASLDMLQQAITQCPDALWDDAGYKNIFWQVGSSATLGTNSVFYGTIMALQSITLNTGATLPGNALARNAAVTLDSNPIN